MEESKLKAELLKSYEYLNKAQIFKLLAWAFFAPKKADKYNECIKAGMNGKFAFEEAKKVR